MKSFPVLLLCVIAWSCFANTVHCSNENTWAILVAGLDIYQFTYGFESNIYRLYNLCIKRGIPADHIIVISPDTAAFHYLNIFPGIVAPGFVDKLDDAVNAYENVTIDYDSEARLTSKLFFSILQGNSTALEGIGSGKVLKSGPKDTIFFYYIGFGFYGNFFINNYNYVWADHFIYTLEDLIENKRFAKIYINIESAYPASIFEELIESKQIIARSLGGRYTDLHFCHYNYDIKAYTSTCSSFLYLTALEQSLKQNQDQSKWSLNDDYLAHRSLTSKFSSILPIPNLYGNLKLGEESISNYIGSKNTKKFAMTTSEAKSQVLQEKLERVAETAVPAKEAFLNAEGVSKEDKAFLKKAVENMVSESIKGTHITQKHIDSSELRLTKDKYDCFRSAVNVAATHCGTQENQHVLHLHTDVLAKLCMHGVSKEKIMAAAENACSQQSKTS